jgi:hypothetical protein
MAVHTLKKDVALIWCGPSMPFFGQQILTLEDNTASPLLEWRELLWSFSKSELPKL